VKASNLGGRPSVAAWALPLLLLAGCSRCVEPPPTAEQVQPVDPDVAAIDRALERGAAYLVAAQAEDGAWRSEAYGAFKDGHSLTPMVLASLMFAPDVEGRSAAYRRGVDFAATVVVGDKLAAGFDAPSYPVYSAALTAVVLSAPQNDRHLKVRDVLVRELRALQLPTGGWGYTSRSRQSANLSSTLWAVGALRLSGVAVDDPDLVRARGFVERCQNHPGDGGFFHSPDLPDGNKAGELDGRPRSYGSMTADGARALARVGAGEARQKAAAAWLDANFEAARNPGVFPEQDEVRRASAYYYWAWSASHAMLQAGRSGWARPLAKELVGRQREDGAWRNDYTEMREDDPLVATAMAMAALSVSRYRITGAWTAKR
jgi:hypothetical protein